jgi:hypothetical protein
LFAKRSTNQEQQLRYSAAALVGPVQREKGNTFLEMKTFRQSRPIFDQQLVRHKKKNSPQNNFDARKTAEELPVK